jgi:hypothetical protein
MTDTFRKLACVLVLLALTGSVSGAGFVTAEHAGIVLPFGNLIAQQFLCTESRIGNPYLWQPCYSLCRFIRFDTPRKQAEIDCADNCRVFISGCRG